MNRTISQIIKSWKFYFSWHSWACHIDQVIGTKFLGFLGFCSLFLFKNLNILFKFLKILFPEKVKYFPQILFLNLIETSFKERVIFPSDGRYFWLLGIFRKFHFPIVMDNWDGYIFLMGERVGRIFIAASNKDLGANHNVSLSFLLGELVTSNRRSFWLRPSWVVRVGEAVVINFW